jgi:LuxR family maltose regulon positive regulatory protein
MSGGDGEVTVVIGRLDPLLSRGLAHVLREDSRVRVLAVDLDDHALECLAALRAPSVAVVSEFVDGGLLGRLASHRISPAVIVVAGRPTSLFGSVLLRAGVSCVAADADVVDVLAAVVRVARGEPAFVAGNRVSMRRPHKGPQSLSDRETDVLDCLRQDMTSAEIALELQISVATVRTHTRAIFRKLGVQNRRELVERELPDGKTCVET